MQNITSLKSIRRAICGALSAGVAASAFITAGAYSLAPAYAAGIDDRTTITLDTAEREHLLAGMRTYLVSVQGIVAALAENQTPRIAEAAKPSGAKALQTVSPITAVKLPAGFVSISFDTHDKFDKLAERALKQPSRGEMLSDVRDLLANCTSCHMMYRLTP